MTPPLTQLRPKSRNTPPLSQYKFIDSFVELVTRDLQSLDRRNPQYMNLSKEEKLGLELLRANNELVIKHSNKGGNIVLMDRIMYLDMVMRLLDDRSTYEVLPGIRMQQYLTELKGIIQQGLEEGCISTEEHKYMWNQAPTLSTFYALPKVHKNKVPVPDRHIVSGSGNLTH